MSLLRIDCRRAFEQFVGRVEGIVKDMIEIVRNSPPNIDYTALQDAP